MHPLAAKLFHENFGMLLVSKTENLVLLLLPNHGMSVPRKRQAVCSAEFLDFLAVRAGALLFNEADRVRETAFRRPFKARLTMLWTQHRPRVSQYQRLLN
jgi:hypothetical protein